MTKAELIELLEYLEDDTEIYFSYPAGDYWHSTKVVSVDNGDFEKVKYSEYHESLTLMDSDIVCSEDEEDKSVFVLR